MKILRTSNQRIYPTCLYRTKDPKDAKAFVEYLRDKQRSSLNESEQETSENTLADFTIIESDGWHKIYPTPRARPEQPAEAPASPDTQPNQETTAQKTTSNRLCDYISTDTDIDLFVRTVANLWSDNHTKDTDDIVSVLPRQALQLLWIVAAYLNKDVRPSERTLDNMIKLLGACIPQAKRRDQTPFDILIEDCKIESIQDKYAYFKHQTFGVHSNCYRETVRLCTEALREVSLTELIEAINTSKNKRDAATEDSPKPLFGALTQNTGQDLQAELYTKLNTAIHEAGHAVAHYLLKEDFSGVTIVETDKSAGCVVLGEWCKKESHEAIIDYAGAAAVEVFFAPVPTNVHGNRTDMRLATQAVKREVINELSNPRDALQYIFIDADALGLADKESPYIIYETIKRCVDLRQEAIDLITSHKDLVAALAEELLKKQSMPSEEVIQFLDEWKTRNGV